MRCAALLLRYAALGGLTRSELLARVDGCRRREPSWSRCRPQTWNVSGLPDLSRLFAYDNGVGAVDLEHWDVSRATSLASFGAGAPHLRADLARWDVSHVRNFSRAFAGAEAFDSDLSGWNLSAARDLRGMFAGASSLRADLSAWDLRALPPAAVSGILAGARPCACPRGLPPGACWPRDCGPPGPVWGRFAGAALLVAAALWTAVLLKARGPAGYAALPVNEDDAASLRAEAVGVGTA
jgi:hypothetical protein